MASMNWQLKLANCIFNTICDYISTRSRLLLERVCTRWRNLLVDGCGWAHNIDLMWCPINDFAGMTEKLNGRLKHHSRVVLVGLPWTAHKSEPSAGTTTDSNAYWSSCQSLHLYVVNSSGGWQHHPFYPSVKSLTLWTGKQGRQTIMVPPPSSLPQLSCLTTLHASQFPPEHAIFINPPALGDGANKHMQMDEYRRCVEQLDSSGPHGHNKYRVQSQISVYIEAVYKDLSALVIASKNHAYDSLSYGTEIALPRLSYISLASITARPAWESLVLRYGPQLVSLNDTSLTDPDVRDMMQACTGLVNLSIRGLCTVMYSGSATLKCISDHAPVTMRRLSIEANEILFQCNLSSGWRYLTSLVHLQHLSVTGLDPLALDDSISIFNLAETEMISMSMILSNGLNHLPNNCQLIIVYRLVIFLQRYGSLISVNDLPCAQWLVKPCF